MSKRHAAHSWARRSAAVTPILVFLTVILFSGGASAVGFGGSESDLIEATLNDYLYGVRDGDVSRLRRAFHADAEIEGIREGRFTSWSVQQYVRGFTAGEQRHFTPRILAVDYVGNAAVGKVEQDYGDWKFVDYMQLLKVDGHWKIVNKIYERVVNVDPVE